MSRDDNHESQFTSGHGDLMQELEEGNRRAKLIFKLVTIEERQCLKI